MLDEILTLVRSIDKATNRTPPDLGGLELGILSGILSSTPSSWPKPTYLSPRVNEMIESTRRLQESQNELREAAKKIHQARLKDRLVSEVGKTDSALATALEIGDANYNGETLMIKLKHVIPKTRLQLVEEVANRMGLKVDLTMSIDAI